MKNVEAYLRRMASELLHALGAKHAFVQVFVLKDANMLSLARKAGVLPNIKKTKVGKKLREEKQVNVLSFPETVPFPDVHGLRPLGEVYLNYDWAEGKREILAYLLIHGILHLSGYRHNKIRDTIKMEKLEKHLWRHVLSSG